MARYTHRFLAAKRRYEDTDQPMPSIALDMSISLRTLHRMVEREGWRKRNDRPPRDLSRADQLLEEAIALARAFEEQQSWNRQIAMPRESGASSNRKRLFPTKSPVRTGSPAGACPRAGEGGR